MTVIQSLVAASAAFVKLAPTTVPTDPSPELVAAFRRYRYWWFRWMGVSPSLASEDAGINARYLAEQRVVVGAWDACRAQALHWAERPARIKAAELAAGKAAPVR